MNMMKPVGRDEFETVATVMLDLAKVQYMHRTKLRPQLIVVGNDPKAPKDGERYYRFGVMEVQACFSEEAGAHGKKALSQLIQRLLKRPDVVTVGLALEAKVTPIRHEAESDEAFALEQAPSECLFLSMFSTDCQGIKMCPITRTEHGASFAQAELVFGSMYFDGDGLFDKSTH